MSFARVSEVIFVLIAPGSTELILTEGANSKDKDLTKPSKALLLETYKEFPFSPNILDIEEIRMMFLAALALVLVFI